MTTRLEATLVALAGQLTELDARWALVGGLAVSVRAEPRFTRDVDVAMSVASDEEAEDVVRRLTAAGYSTELSLEQEATDRLATVRLVPPGETVEGPGHSSGDESVGRWCIRSRGRGHPTLSHQRVDGRAHAPPRVHDLSFGLVLSSPHAGPDPRRL